MDLKPPSIKLVAIISLAASFFLYSTGSFFSDPGIGWHLGTAQYFFDNLKLPTNDIFLAKNIAGFWIAEQYLADLINYSLLNNLGWHGTKAVIFISMLYFYWFFLYPKISKEFGQLIATLVIFIAFEFTSVHFVFRPIYFSFFCFGSVYILLTSFSKKQYQISLLDYLKLIFIFALWSNLHPTFLLGIILILIHFFCCFILSLREKSLVFWNITKILLVSLGAIGLNPYGYQVLFQVLSFGSSKYSLYLYQEWESLNLHDFHGKMLLLITLFVIILPLIQKRKKYILSEVVILLVFMAMSFSHYRILPYFGIVAIYPLARSAIAFLSYLAGSKTVIGKYFYGLFFRLERVARKGFDLNFPVYVVILGCGIFLLNFSMPAFTPEKDLSSYPWKALDYVKKQGNTVVVNDINFGGWLNWYGKGIVRGVIDDRTSLLGEQYYKLYDRYMTPEEDWRSYAKTFNANYLFLSSKSKLAKYLIKNDKSRVVFKDDLAIVYRISYEN